MAPPTPTTRDDYAKRILRVLVHIQQNLDTTLSLDELARIACFSPFHFHRVFRGMVGESVAHHVRRLRLERAAMQLKYTRRPVTEIALAAGYESHEAFTRAFRATFGRSPSGFRKEVGASIGAVSATGLPSASPDASVSFDPVDEGRTLHVQLKTVPSLRVAFLRHVGPYDQVGQTWERLTDWAGARCLFGPETHLLGVCYDDPEVTEAGTVRYDACITVDSSFEADGEVGVCTLPGGRYAVTLHEGPYAQLNETYARLFGGWLPAHHFEPGDPPSLEFYLNDPGCTEPEDLLTEVWVRLR